MNNNFLWLFTVWQHIFIVIYRKQTFYLIIELKCDTYKRENLK